MSFNGTHGTNGTNGGSVEAIKILLAAGAKVGVYNDGGKTPLHGAAEGGYCEVIAVLLDHGSGQGGQGGQGGQEGKDDSKEGEGGQKGQGCVDVNHGTREGNDCPGSTALILASEGGESEKRVFATFPKLFPLCLYLSSN